MTEQPEQTQEAVTWIALPIMNAMPHNGNYTIYSREVITDTVQHIAQLAYVLLLSGVDPETLLQRITVDTE